MMEASTSSIDGVDLDQLYAEVKEVEKRDSVLTPKQQIERLLRKGSTYFNLNPFEVLQVDHDTSLEDIKKKYRRLSILVHPDKNIDDSDRAQKAFDAVNNAYKTLEDEEKRKKALEVVEEATARTKQMMDEKRKKLRREGKSTEIDEDDPDKFKKAVATLTMKLFADKERRRRQLETRDVEERRRQREGEIEQEEKAKVEKEWQKNFEDSREDRVKNWQAFKGGVQKKRKKKNEFVMPKFKMEKKN